MTTDDLSSRILQIEKVLAATRATARIAAVAAILGWIGVAILLVILRSTPSRIVVKDDLGNSAVVSGTGLTFESSKGKPVAWFSVSPVPQLQMTRDGVPYVRLEIGALGEAYGLLQLRSKDGGEQLIRPSPPDGSK